MNVFHLVYLAAIVIEIIIRAPHNRRRKQTQVAVDRVSSQERGILGLLVLGMFVLPVIYIFTPWLAFANYTLPAWASWLGVLLMLGALIVFWQAHVDLGANWSPTLQIMAQHRLIENGLYRFIRHPMYASQMLWILAQPLLLQNWLAGVLGGLLFLPLYWMRVPREEQMLLEQFGDAYRAYMARTGRVLPKLRT